MNKIISKNGIEYAFKKGVGEPVILLHGFLEDLNMWQGVIAAIPNPVYAPNFPGIGNSSFENQNSINSLSKKIRNWFSELNILPAIVLGHSMGGYVALQFAKNYPENVLALGLLQSTSKPDSSSKIESRNSLIAHLNNYSKKAIIQSIPSLFSNISAQNFQQSISEIQQNVEQTSTEVLLSQIEAMRDRADHSVFLQEIKKPVLLVSSTNDSLFQVRDVIEESFLINKAVVCILPNTGHMATYENPSKLLKVINDFLILLKEI